MAKSSFDDSKDGSSNRLLAKVQVSASKSFSLETSPLFSHQLSIRVKYWSRLKPLPQVSNDKVQY